MCLDKIVQYFLPEIWGKGALALRSRRMPGTSCKTHDEIVLFFVWETFFEANNKKRRSLCPIARLLAGLAATVKVPYGGEELPPLWPLVQAVHVADPGAGGGRNLSQGHNVHCHLAVGVLHLKQ